MERQGGDTIFLALQPAVGEAKMKSYMICRRPHPFPLSRHKTNPRPIPSAAGADRLKRTLGRRLSYPPAPARRITTPAPPSNTKSCPIAVLHQSTHGKTDGPALCRAADCAPIDSPRHCARQTNTRHKEDQAK